MTLGGARVLRVGSGVSPKHLSDTEITELRDMTQSPRWETPSPTRETRVLPEARNPAMIPPS
jgi:hypothetical protein